MKRSRQLSFASDAARDSRASSVSTSGVKPKKARLDSLSDTSTVVPFKTDVDMLDDSATEGQQSLDHVSADKPHDLGGSTHSALVLIHTTDRRNADTVHPRQTKPYTSQYETVTMKRDSSMSSHATDEGIQWNVPPGRTDPTWSFDSSRSGQFHSHGFPNQTTFPGRQDYEFPQYQQQNMVQVQQVHHLREPSFQTVPNTPIFPQATISLGNYNPTSCEVPQAVTYSAPMPSGQYFLPASSDPTVAAFNPSPTAYASRPHQQDQRHIASMQYGGLPHQAEWSQQLYHHHHRA